MKGLKAYEPATATVITLGNDDIIRTSPPGIILPDVELKSVQPIEPEASEE